MPALPPINRDKLNQQKLGYFGKFGSGGNVEVTYIQTVLDFDFLDKITLIEHIKGSDRWDVQDLFQRNVDDVRVSKEIFPFFQNSETIKFFAPLALVLLPIDGNEINPQLDELKTKDLSLPEGEYKVHRLSNLYEFHEHVEEPAYSHVKWDDTKVKIVAVDGQHRLSALKRIMKDDPPAPILGHMKIPVILIGFSKTVGDVEGRVPKLLEVVRQTFVYINSKSQRINESRKILLDNEDLNAVCTQQIVQAAHSNDQNDSINNIEKTEIPLMMYDWRGEEMPVPASIFSVRDIYDWLTEYIIGSLDSPSDVEIRKKVIPRLGLDNLVPPMNVENVKNLNLENSSKIRQQFDQLLSQHLRYVIENIKPYQKYIAEIRKIQQEAEDEAQDAGREAFKWICFGPSSRDGAINREAVEAQFNLMCSQLNILKTNSIPRLLTRDIGIRAIWSSYDMLKTLRDEHSATSLPWKDFSEWYVPLMNKVIKEGWFNDIADADFAIDMRKILTHIVYSPSGGIVNYRLSDVKKGLGSLVMMLVLQKNRNKELCSTGWEDIKDDLTATVKKGFRREIKADMDLNWTGLNMQQFNEELQNRLDKRVLQWEESMIDLFRI